MPPRIGRQDQCDRLLILCYDSFSHDQYRLLNKKPLNDKFHRSMMQMHESMDVFGILNSTMYIFKVSLTDTFADLAFYFNNSIENVMSTSGCVLLIVPPALFNPVIVSPATHPSIKLSSDHHPVVPVNSNKGSMRGREEAQLPLW